MLPLLSLIAMLLVVALLLVVFETQSVCLEEIIVDIDFAGRLMGDNLLPVADPQMQSPEWAHSVEEIAVSMACNGDALGAESVIMILSGNAIADGPMELVIGASGSEDVDIIHSGVAATVLMDLGIKINPGASYEVFFQMVGEDGGEAGCTAELVFNSKQPRERKQWVVREAQNIAIANVQGANLAGVDMTVLPGTAKKIGGIIGATMSDGAALGVGSVVAILSLGVKERQEYNLGAFGGELITSEGDTVGPTQRFVDVPLKGSAIFVEFRMVNEDTGTTSSAVSIGLVL